MMPEMPSTETQVAITQEQLKNVIKQLETVITTVNTLDAKLDAMQGQYLTSAQFRTWKDEEYQPHKKDVALHFEKQDTRINRWLGGLVGSAFTAVLTLTVYLIVALAGGGKP